MKTLLLSRRATFLAAVCLWGAPPAPILQAAEPPQVLFCTDFAADGVIRDVALTFVSKDAEGFTTSRALRASELPELQRARFAALQTALSSSANAGGWRLTGGELAQTGSTADYREVPNPEWRDGVSTSEIPPRLRVPIAGTERAVLTLWMTQQRDGKVRYQTITSEQWPPKVRAAVIGLWAWVQTQ